MELIAEKINSTRLFRSLKNKLGGLCPGLSRKKNSTFSFLFKIFSRSLHTAVTVLLSVLKQIGLILCSCAIYDRCDVSEVHISIKQVC